MLRRTRRILPPAAVLGIAAIFGWLTVQAQQPTRERQRETRRSKGDTAPLRDVIVEPKSGRVGPSRGVDTTPPRIAFVLPDPGPWVRDTSGVPQVQIVFDEPVTIPPGAILVWTVGGSAITDFTPAFDGITNALTITFATPIRDDRLTVVVDYTVTDLAGNELDGEVFDPAVPVMPSGDGQRGGQAVFRFNILQGDANRDGAVDAADGTIVGASLGRCLGDASFDPDADLNQDGCVNVLDVGAVQLAQGQSLAPLDGTAPAIARRSPDVSERLRVLSLETVVVTFSEVVQPFLITPTTLFALAPDGTLQYATSVLVDPTSTQATFTFVPPLSQNGNHAFHLSNGVADTSGELISPAPIWSSELDQGPTRILKTSPTGGENMVALTRETIITIEDSIKLQPGQVLTNDDIFATFGGNKLPLLGGAPRLMPDGKRIKLFYDPPLPASVRVRLTINGANLFDDFGNVLDPDGDGLPGGTTIIDFDTCSSTRIPGTVLWGYVMASERGPSGEDLPLEGVTISADDVPDLVAVTDSTGFFALGGNLAAPSDCDNLDVSKPGTPAPEFFIHIDGRTATSLGGQPIPPNGFYPNVGKPLHSTPGHCLQIAMDGEPFNIYMPFVPDDSLETVTPDQPTEVGLTPEAIERMAELFPEVDPALFAMFQMTVPANSLTNDDGTPGQQVGIFPVPTGRLPAPRPPSGPINTIDMTIQTDGAANFDVPVPICFPNLPDPDTGVARDPGEAAVLMSFNHDTGHWEAGGPMTVTSDGSRVCTDPGVGVAAPGWHGQSSGTSVWNGFPIDPSNTNPDQPGCPFTDFDPLKGANEVGFIPEAFVCRFLRLAYCDAKFGRGCREGGCEIAFPPDQCAQELGDCQRSCNSQHMLCINSSDCPFP